MGKTLKTVAAAATYFDAGFAAGVADGRTELIVQAVAEDKLEQALADYTEGYVFGRITVTYPKTELLAARKLARDIMGWVNPDAKTVPEGKAKRTHEQHNWYIAGKRKFNRAREKLNVDPINNSGGAREKTSNKEPGEKLPTATSAQDANMHVRNIALMLSTYVSKNKTHVSAELSSLVADFVGNLNKLT